ncbi:hypothetical protein EDC04DRAFT_2839732, partial [Pisolithus marmoratus]
VGMLSEVVVVVGTFAFGHTLGIFCACLPHSIICSATKVCPVRLLCWEAFVIDDVHPSLATVVSKANCKGRSSVVVGIDYDNEIVC